VNKRCAKKVCAIGGATLDLIIAYEDMEMMKLEQSNGESSYLILEEGSKIEVSDLHYFSGGGATNAAVTFARQGLGVHLFCKIGEDASGKMVLEDLSSHGLDTKYIYKSKSAGTSSSFVVPSLSGDRTIFAYRGANATLLSKELPIDGIKSSDFVYVTSLSKESADRLPEIVSIAKEAGVPVAVNPGISQLKSGASSLKEALINGVDTLIINDDEAAQLMASLIHTDEKLANIISNYMQKLGQKSAKKLGQKSGSKNNKAQNSALLIDDVITFGDLTFSLRHFFKHIIGFGVNQVIVTHGAKGVCVATKDKLYFHDTPKGVSVVNTLGAGDAFGSAFTRAWYQGDDIKKSIISGMLNSASVIQHADAKSGTLILDDLSEKIKGFHERTKTKLMEFDWK
jgi:ribokinase